MHDFRRLRVWHEARALASTIYKLFGDRRRTDPLIATQVRRAAIAGGCGKHSRAEALRYLDIASRSAAETEHHLEQARDVGIISETRAQALIDTTRTVRRMLRALIDPFPA